MSAQAYQPTVFQLSSFPELLSTLARVDDLPTPSDQNAEAQMQNKPDDTTAACPSTSPTAGATPAADPIISSITHQLGNLDIAPPATTPAPSPALSNLPPPTQPTTRPQTPEREEMPDMIDDNDNNHDDDEGAGILRPAHPKSTVSKQHLSNAEELQQRMLVIQIAQLRAEGGPWYRRERAAIKTRRHGRDSAYVAKRAVGSAASQRIGLSRRAAGTPDGASRERLVRSEGDEGAEVDMEEGGCVPARAGEFEGMGGGEASGDVDMDGV